MESYCSSLLTTLEDSLNLAMLEATKESRAQHVENNDKSATSIADGNIKWWTVEMSWQPSEYIYKL
jgi:hypothetical protein